MLISTAYFKKNSRYQSFCTDTYITEDGASISELSEERILCCRERIIVRLRFVFLIFLLVLDLETRNMENSLTLHFFFLFYIFAHRLKKITLATSNTVERKGDDVCLHCV